MATAMKGVTKAMGTMNKQVCLCFMLLFIVIKLSHHTMLDVSICCVIFQIWMHEAF